MFHKLNGERKFFAKVGFFTGLRGRELILLFRDWDMLRKKDFNGVLVVETGFIRRTKRSYLTMMPLELVDRMFQ
jgi:intergrase/recombinase